MSSVRAWRQCRASRAQPSTGDKYYFANQNLLLREAASSPRCLQPPGQAKPACLESTPVSQQTGGGSVMGYGQCTGLGAVSQLRAGIVLGSCLHRRAEGVCAGQAQIRREWEREERAQDCVLLWRELPLQ